MPNLIKCQSISGLDNQTVKAIFQILEKGDNINIEDAIPR